MSVGLISNVKMSLQIKEHILPNTELLQKEQAQNHQNSEILRDNEMRSILSAGLRSDNRALTSYLGDNVRKIQVKYRLCLFRANSLHKTQM